MVKGFGKGLSFILILVLILNLNGFTYAQKENSVTPSGLSKSELYNSMEDYIKENKDTTAGLAISVFNDKEELYLGYHGYADIENQIPVSKDTVFEWGSVSKLLIWVSVFQLWEQDKIDLNEDIRTYLPQDFLKKVNKNEKITMLNLMHHDGGWQEVVVDLFVEDVEDIEDLKKTLQKTEPEQVYPVGKYKAYSNWGSALAAYIVQEITGQKYYDYVHKNIFKPLGMENTGLLPDLRDNQWVQEKRKETKGYTVDNEIILDDFLHIPLYPVGMVTGTLKDLEKFGKGLINYKGQENLFQKEETINILFDPSLYYEGTQYPRNANGFWFQELGVTTLGHGGNTKAFSSYLLLDPTSNTCLVTMTNQSVEEIYNTKMMPIIFGTFNPNPSNTLPEKEENLGGLYQIPRTLSKGYGKLYSIITRVNIKDTDNKQIKLSWPGNSFNGYEFEQSLYNVDSSLFQIYKDKDQSTIMATAYQDFYKLKTSQIIVDYSLIILAILAILYSIIMLIVELIAFIRSKIKGQESLKNVLERYSLLVLFEILFVFLNILIMARKMLNYDILKNIKPHIYLSFICMITLLGYFIFSIFYLRKSNIKGKKKVKHILTSMASLIIGFNIFYWQLYLIR